MFVMGGDFCFVVEKIFDVIFGDELIFLFIEKFIEFFVQVEIYLIDDLVLQFYFSFFDVEILVFVFFIYLMFVCEIGVDMIYVLNVSFCDGFLLEMVSSDFWLSEFSEQMIKVFYKLG